MFEVVVLEVVVFGVPVLVGRYLKSCREIKVRAYLLKNSFSKSFCYGAFCKNIFPHRKGEKKMILLARIRQKSKIH